MIAWHILKGVTNVNEKYFDMLKSALDRAYSTASEARSKCLDPVDRVEVRIAKDVAARVEGIVGPKDIAEVIRGMEKGGMAREDIAFEIARKIAAGELYDDNKEKLIEQAVRTGVGILTEGVLVAPTEGISKVRIKENPDGSDFVAVYYAGPIRSAGGTAAALSIVLADISRRAAGVGDYRATDTQVERYVEEVNVYEARVTHLQYMPSEKDLRHIIKNCPVCIDGDPTEEIEVSAYKGVPGVETDRVRGGVPLVACEGVALKSAKLLKYTKKLNLGWDWLEDIIKIKKKADKIEIKPDPTYLEGLVAGRPVFSHASAKGGFRLRYGRSRTNGLMSKNIHPATMVLLDDFLAYGTHMKIERPGKGCVVVAHEGIEPPVVKLKDGTVMKVHDREQAISIKDKVEEILFLGDMLIAYGDFLKSNHPLLPPGYCEEWWRKELEEASVKAPEYISAVQAFDLASSKSIPLHPNYTYNWHDISLDQLFLLCGHLTRGHLSLDDDRIRSFSIPLDEGPKRVLEELLIEHRVVDGHIILETDEAYSLLMSLGMLKEGEVLSQGIPDLLNTRHSDTLNLVNKMSGITIRAKAPTYIGGRMGRPEKAKERKMDGSPQVLFPTGSFKNRSLMKIYRSLKSREAEKTINVEIARYRCSSCNAVGFYHKCEICSSIAKPENVCQECGIPTGLEEHCQRATQPFERRPINIVDLFESARDKIGFLPEDVKGVRGLSNSVKIPERLEKGLLRAKHNIYVFRDGTCRFDATDVTLSHFIPDEAGVSIECLHDLGYEKDYLGAPLERGDQIVPLKHQDVILAESCAEYFFRVASFIDEMLINLYNLKPFYDLKSKEDLAGHMAVGLSPHTSAGALCRIVGFTKANVGYAHPYFHTVKRRNCDGDEDCLILLMDALLNFSLQYLNTNRGGTMDAPLVLSTVVNPKEVDDEVYCMELVHSYPLDFYRAASRITPPSDVKLKTVLDILGTSEQYESMPLTHPGGYTHNGNLRTAYVTLQSIPEKVEAEFALHKKIRAVDSRDAAERLIMNHFIPDLYGNLRSYSRQTFRCVSCNEIYRRIPLIGKCTKCGGKLLLTINKGGIKKYLKIARQIAEDYDLPNYLKQRLEIFEIELKSIFEDDKVKQTGLADFL